MCVNDEINYSIKSEDGNSSPGQDSGKKDNVPVGLRSKQLAADERKIQKYVDCLCWIYGILTLLLLAYILFFHTYWVMNRLKDFDGWEDRLLEREYVVLAVAIFIMVFCLFKWVKYIHLKMELHHKEYLLDLLESFSRITEQDGNNNETDSVASQHFTNSRRIKDKENLDLFVKIQIKKTENSFMKEFFKGILDDKK